MNFYDRPHFTKYSLEGTFRLQQCFTNYVCKWYFWEPGFYKRISPEFRINNNFFNLQWIFMINPILQSSHWKVHFGFSNVLQIMCANGTFENLVLIWGFDLNVELIITSLISCEYLRSTPFHKVLIRRCVSASATFKKLCLQMVLSKTRIF